MKTAKKKKSNTELLVDALIYNEIKLVRVPFSGSGDSGQLDNPEAKSIDDDVEITTAMLDTIIIPEAKPYRPIEQWSAESWLRETWRKNRSR